jgi:two-component system, chemotaxis family, protein-glutamate methylesterase/glutaminase
MSLDIIVGQFAIVVIGASLGGVEALQELVSGLKPEISAAFFVVQHVGPNHSSLPQILSKSGPLSASHARQGEVVRRGRIFIAPPDHHLVLANGTTALTRGPRENWARPAIDPLFRSAAAAYGRRVIGVILTGALNDGTSGLKEVRAHGGIAVVQDPTEATCPMMPVSALRHAGADFTVRLTDMPALLQDLAGDIADNETPIAVVRGARKRKST